jgi:diaminopimelate epimerase
MQFKFYKYQGAGNDFILFDNRNKKFPTNNIELYNKLCDRRFGIGADGIMLLENIDKFDFKMLYYNADGKESTMCGNGGRCLVRFAEDLNIIHSECHFLAVDGPHYAKISEKVIELGMIDVNSWNADGNDITLNTGSPHYIKWVEDIHNIDVYKQGGTIRYNETYKQNGINVNFVEWLNDSLYVRTYERGVEDETLSCGTGVTAAAMAYAIKNNLYGTLSVPIKTKGGNLSVRFNRVEQYFSNVYLIGPAVKVFEGQIEIS